MANYNCVQRTNYFHVKDPEAFRNLMTKVEAEDFSFWEEKDEAGNLIFAFGCFGSIAGIPIRNEEGELETGDESYEDFLTELQKCIEDNDAIILIESGYEKLRYVSGIATVISSDSIKYLDVSRTALGLARRMLKDEKYDTRMDY